MDSVGLGPVEAEVARWVLPVEAHHRQVALLLNFGQACYIVRLMYWMVVWVSSNSCSLTGLARSRVP